MRAPGGRQGERGKDEAEEGTGDVTIRVNTGESGFCGAVAGNIGNVSTDCLSRLHLLTY